jgi:hypothetical protein
MTLLRRDHLDRPHPQRFATLRNDRELVLARHREAVEQGAISYTDPATGYRVFTAAHLAAQGSCCDNGCRHCPYIGAGSDPD